MKKRIGFVSNSSSSSFICDVCGREESGYDTTITDFGMVECINDHIFCKDEQKIDEETMRRILLEDVSLEHSSDEISNMDISEIRDLFNDVVSDNDWAWEYPEELCPICQFDYIIKNDGFEYLLKKTGIDEKQLLIEIKEKFGNYNEFSKFLKGIL